MDGESTVNIAASATMQQYFQELQKEINRCYDLAQKARQKGRDPSQKIEIPQALDLAARVEQLVGPKNIAPIIRQTTKKIGNREIVSLEIAKQIASGTTYKFKNIELALDQAIRTGLAILTEGVLVAPLEGIAEVKLGSNKDGSKYVDLYFSGPIRSAGGTGQAMSVLIADVVRRQLGLAAYQASTGEIERYKEEIPLYKRVQHLQYVPTVDEIERVVKNCPICINGEGTEDEEVTGYRDLPRVGTNRLRGGACLVIAEGLCLKAPKIYKHIKKLNLTGWDFLEIFVNKGITPDKKTDEIPLIPPSSKYIGEVIAGRPVFSHPSRKGGFRLRYGRARTAGLASTAINPASMYVLDSFITVGTQMKTERPGKGTIGTPCDQIEGPIVLLQNGDLVQINNKNQTGVDIKKIIDLGEILIPFGEFIENNALLPDASYTYEWWIQDVQKALTIKPTTNTYTDVQNADQQTQEKINEQFEKNIDLHNPTAHDAFLLSEHYNIPLHPNYNLFWHDITTAELTQLQNYIQEKASIQQPEKNLIIPYNPEIKNILIELGALHQQSEEKLIFDTYTHPLIRCLGFEIKDEKIIPTSRKEQQKNQTDTITLVSQLAGIQIRPRAPFRIGTRMGRPEKAAARKMRPPPHVLFPLGNYGGNQRLFSTAAENQTIEVEMGKRKCIKCNQTTYKLFCSCGGHTEPMEGRIEAHQINLTNELNEAKRNIKERNLPETIKGVIGTISKHKTPEALEKGILRAKHDVHVFKDGTIRFDMTDAPLTHFKPREINTSVKRLRELGYTKDYLEHELENDEQICELRVQDVIIPNTCAEFFIQVTKFIDDLLTKFYSMDRFYKVKKPQDLTGHLVVGLAPHTSAGALGRIIGYTTAQVCFSHPFYHATKRRNCLSPDTNIVLLQSDRPTHIKIQELYDCTKTNEIIVDDFGTLKKQISDLQTFAFNFQSKSYEQKKITGVYKIQAPHHLLEVSLKTGRKFIASPAHRVVVWSDGNIVTKKLVEVQPTDRFFVSENISIIDRDIKEIDLIEEFSRLPSGCFNDIAVRGAKSLLCRCIKKLGGLQATAKKLKINKKTFSNYIYRNSIPLKVLFQLLEECDENKSAIPRTCMLGVKRNHAKIPRIITVNEKLMRLLGYYLAEGHSRFTSKSCYQVSIASTEKEMRDDIITCIQDVFHIKPYIVNQSISISNRLVHDFFVDILFIGKNAKNKQIPPQFTGLPKQKIRELLKAYFSGDGCVEKNRLHVSCCSVDRRLLHDIGMQLLRFGIFFRIKEEHRKAAGLAKIFYDKKGVSPTFTLYYLSIRSSYARVFYNTIGFSLTRKQKTLKNVLGKEHKPHLSLYENFILDEIKKISPIISDSKFLYDIEVEDLHNFPMNDFIFSKNCDGDEDGLMLLMDALLNFSLAYIPDKRGGKMDLPLILTTRLDPSEVDKEAHNLDTLSRYPLEFYEATLRHEQAKNMESIMGLVAARLGTELQYEQFGFTHDTNDISAGPKESLYKTLKTMMDKMNVQLSLAAKIRAVDEADVAYKVIERHFLPDILGNLRAFSKQSVRCPSCNITYRRIPLQGCCSKCNGKLTLTVHEMSVKKYLEISREIADKYNLPMYARQRITLVEKSIDSLFESDKVKNTKLTDFF